MKKIINRSVMLFILITQLTGCVAVSIKERDIEKMTIAFKDYYGGEYRTNSLEPGRTYKVEVMVYERGKAKPIKHPNFDEMDIRTNDNLVITKDTSYSLRVSPRLPSGGFLFDSSYHLSIAILENDFNGIDITFKTDWSSFNYLDYSGNNGISGIIGTSGNSSHPWGYEGGRGGDGENGPIITMEVAYIYNTDQMKLPDGLQRMIFAYNKDYGRTFIFGANSFTVDASGGNGGRGGQGGRGASGDSRENHPIDGASGGIGGRGGNGGNGGSVILITPKEQNVVNAVKININGGKGGIGGLGGSGGSGATRHHKDSDGKIIRSEYGRSGSPGMSGSSGISGNSGSFKILQFPLDTLFKECGFISRHPEVRAMMR